MQALIISVGGWFSLIAFSSFRFYIRYMFLRLGFIVQSDILPPDLVALYEVSKKDPNFEICLIVSYEDGTSPNSYFIKILQIFKTLGFRKFLARALLKLVYLFEAKVSKIRFSEENNKYLDITSLTVPILRATPNFSKSRLVARFNDTDIDYIASYEIDVLVRVGKHILRGSILETCSFGVIGLHHGDDGHYRGSPSGFWEVYNYEAKTSFMIQRLRDTLDRGDIYVKQEFSTKATAWDNTLNQHYLARIEFMRFMKDLAGSYSVPEVKELNTEILPVNKAPTFSQLLKYIYYRLFRNS